MSHRYVKVVFMPFLCVFTTHLYAMQAEQASSVNEKRAMVLAAESAAAKSERPASMPISMLSRDLFQAVRAGDAERDEDVKRVAKLLDDGANPDVLDDGKSSFMIAAQLGKLRFVTAFLDRGAMVDLEGVVGMTALGLAASKGQAGVIRALMAAPAGFDHQRHVIEALEEAVMGGHSATIRALVEGGADPKCQDDGGRTALMTAAWFDQVGAIQTLIEVGADMEHEDENGDTALIYAGMGYKSEALRKLIELGADLDHKDKFGLTALEYCGFASCAQILREAMEKRRQSGLPGLSSTDH